MRKGAHTTAMSCSWRVDRWCRLRGDGSGRGWAEGSWQHRRVSRCRRTREGLLKIRASGRRPAGARSVNRRRGRATVRGQRMKPSSFRSPSRKASRHQCSCRGWCWREIARARHMVHQLAGAIFIVRFYKRSTHSKAELTAEPASNHLVAAMAASPPAVAFVPERHWPAMTERLDHR